MTPKTIAGRQVEPVRVGPRDRRRRATGRRATPAHRGSPSDVRQGPVRADRPPVVRLACGRRGRRSPAGKTQLLGLLLDVLVVSAAPSSARVSPEPTATVICSSDGPLTGDRNSSAGRGGVRCRGTPGCPARPAGHVGGQRGAVDDVRTRRARRRRDRLGPSTDAMNARNSFAASTFSVVLGMYVAGRHPDGGAVLGGVVARLRRRSRCRRRCRGGWPRWSTSAKVSIG